MIDNKVKQKSIGTKLMIWEIDIGGYQPAQKRLKDRKGRVLSFEDIQYY
jgi:hypothetical protein